MMLGVGLQGALGDGPQLVQAPAQAIEAGDAARARRAATRHMDNAIARIQQADPAFWQQEGDRLASALTAGAGSGPAS